LSSCNLPSANIKILAFCIPPALVLRTYALKTQLNMLCLLHNHKTQSISHFFTFFTSQSFPFSLSFIYQKDEWALPGNLQKLEFSITLPRESISPLIPIFI
jgi:hypothetical protein